MRPPSGLDRASVAGSGAALAWGLLALRWFDAGAALRPGWLASVPPVVLALFGLACLIPWLRVRGPILLGCLPSGQNRVALGLVLLATLFRLPLAWQGAAGYTTADAALSGIVALHLRDQGAHDVFVPSVPYSGSLKSHVTAALLPVVDPARAFALASVLFYAAFVAGLFRLALLATGEVSVAVGAGLYAAFSPVFVTQYSLSNDGNYVEVLAFGTWALLLAARWLRETGSRPVLALGLGLMLGLGFWCHILVVIHALAIAIFLLAAARTAALRAIPPSVAGVVLGYLPGLIWNANHAWESLSALLPGHQPAAASRGGLAARAALILRDHGPVLMGYDSGYAQPFDGLLRAAATLALLLAFAALAQAVRRSLLEPWGARGLLLVFAVVNVSVAVLGLRYIPGNPRYLLFLVAPLAVFLSELLMRSPWRWLLGLLLTVSALASLAQARNKIEADGRWRSFVRDLEGQGVHFCYTDFYLAAKINFLSEERIVCSSKLGPNRTEYFFEYRERVDRAPEAAFVAVNGAQARKLEARLAALGVGFARRDFLKPVLLPSRKVDPEELFPGEAFGLR